MLRNPYRELLDLLPSQRLDVGEVTDVAGQLVAVELADGGVLQARGVATVGQRVFVRDGVIEGLAPALTYVASEV